MNVNMNMYQGGYYNPGMMMSAIPIFYPVQGMEPMMGYNPYFNGIYGTPPFPYPAPYLNQNSFYGGMGYPKPANSNAKKE